MRYTECPWVYWTKGCFLFKEENPVLLGKLGLNGYKSNTERCFQAENGETDAGNCVISWCPDVVRGRDCVIKGPFHAAWGKLWCRSTQRPSVCSELGSQKDFHLKLFCIVYTGLKKPGYHLPCRWFMALRGTKLHCLGFVLVFRTHRRAPGLVNCLQVLDEGEANGKDFNYWNIY